MENPAAKSREWTAVKTKQKALKCNCCLKLFTTSTIGGFFMGKTMSPFLDYCQAQALTKMNFKINTSENLIF